MSDRESASNINLVLLSMSRRHIFLPKKKCTQIHGQERDQGVKFRSQINRSEILASRQKASFRGSE